ncbi:MAG: ribonuclease Z [Lachnospiraceae bacterium]|nr:ribonuclease Z [Lachnospiraceae bacterium]
MLEICLLGTSGMMPLPGRFLTSCMTRYNGAGLLIDCGEGTQVALRKRGFSCHDIDTILITHTHGDHVSGIPGLLLSMGNAERTEPVTIIGPKGTAAVVSALCIIAPDLPFEIRFIELTKAAESVERPQYTVEAFRVNHGVVCYGYSIVIRRQGRFIPEKAAANAVPMSCWNRLQKGQTIEENGVTYTPDMILGPERRGLKLTYCTDSRPAASITAGAADADLFICEGMYGEPGTEQKAKEHRHMTFIEAATIAKDANVREMWLTHYSPSLVHPEQFVERAREIFPNTVASRDGQFVDLCFDEE